MAREAALLLCMMSSWRQRGGAACGGPWANLEGFCLGEFPWPLSQAVELFAFLGFTAVQQP